MAGTGLAGQLDRFLDGSGDFVDRAPLATDGQAYASGPRRLKPLARGFFSAIAPQYLGSSRRSRIDCCCLNHRIHAAMLSHSSGLANSPASKQAETITRIPPP